MNNFNITVTGAPEKHISVEHMYQYLDNKLIPADRHQVELHLLDCALCNDALAGLSITTQEKTQRQLFEINYHLKNRAPRRKPHNIMQHLKNWGLTTAILLILLLAALLVWYQVKQTANSPKPVKTKKQTSGITNIKTDTYKEAKNRAVSTYFI